MSQRPFRFLHAADLHLDQPVQGLTEAPEHLLDLLIDAPARAAVRMFDAAIDHRVDFVLLAGDVIDPRFCAPREWLLLVEQLERLADRQIPVYWAGGPSDLLDSWPRHLAWPANVRIFPRGRVQRFRHEFAGEPVCEIVGRSHDADGSGQPNDFAPTRGANLFTLAVAHTDWNCAGLDEIGVDYWALGGLHQRSTPWDSAHCVAHYPGSPQGRRPAETGPHGCTIGSVDELGRIGLTHLTCDVLRWHSPRLELTETAVRGDLEQLLRLRTEQLMEESAGTAALISWSVSCQGALLAALRHGSLASELTTNLRAQFGHRLTPAWTIEIAPELPGQLPNRWQEEESLRGDFLRAIQSLTDHESWPLAVAAAEADGTTSADPSAIPPTLLSPDDLPPALAEKIGWAALSLDQAQARRRVLREVAWLGADLLSPQEFSAPEADR